MTTWSPKTKPTPANIRKRIQAAQDAIAGAAALIEANGNPKLKPALTAIRHAEAWLGTHGGAMGRLKR